MGNLQKKHKPTNQGSTNFFLFPNNSRLYVAFDIFDLYGATTLRELKSRARKKFRQIAFQLHPDTGKKKTARPRENYPGGGMYLHQIKSLHDKIQRMKYVPMTIGNCNELLELQKGYKSTADVDLGLNG